MGFSGLLPILVPFILLEGVQEPGLVEAFHSKYWGRGPPSGETELVWEEETESFTDKECFSPPQPEILGNHQIQENRVIRIILEESISLPGNLWVVGLRIRREVKASFFTSAVVPWVWERRALAPSRPQKSLSFPPSGACPKNRVKCAIEERNQCVKNRECPEKMKCCRFGCARQCLNPKQDVCILPKEPGRCLAYLPRWWYDAQNKVCSQFIYGGCQGNSNNFQSQAVCQAICPKRSKSQGLQSPTLTWAALGGLGIVWSIPETQQAWDGQNQSNQEVRIHLTEG
ncbi:WAP, Kazal, immunoglobulin, Kunitz and NTR domain-containing protein 2-like [Camelus dromedarius]|uniref:WAP, Kazal, immunoglobulin, Kunitz and NTR domain-containing protein 2-like n=1 Tax=Camelus dromedarius TaxID=9838 RepID=UPI0031191EEE